MVCRRPRRIRTPSGASTAMKLYWPDSRRQMTPAALSRYTARNPAAAAAVFGSNWSRTTRTATVPMTTMVTSERKTEASRRAVDARHGEAGIAAGDPVGLDVPGEEDQPELVRLRCGQVGQLAVRPSRSGEADTQLRDAEYPSHPGSHDGDRLYARQRQTAGILADEACLNAQGVTLEAPARDHPMDVAVDGGEQRERNQIVGLDCPVFGFGVHGRQEEQQHEGREEAADAGDGRERVQPQPFSVGRRCG